MPVITVEGTTLLVDTDTVLAFDVDTPDTILAVESTNIEILVDALQGPPGPIGKTGAAVTFITLPAAGPISGHFVIRADEQGRAAYADAADAAHANTVLGLSLNAAADGGPVDVQTSGEVIEPSWAWIPGQPVFCGTEGRLTQALPDTGFQLILGIARAATILVVGIKQPIIL